MGSKIRLSANTAKQNLLAELNRLQDENEIYKLSIDEKNTFIKQLVETLKYIESLDINPKTYPTNGTADRLQLASERCKQLLTLAKENGYE